jgi:archaellum component FlaC
MTNPALKKEEKEDKKTVYIHEDCSENQNSFIYEDITNSFQSLEDDAARLTEQKTNLTGLLKQLDNKAKVKVAERKQEVERLNSEVLDLKRQCEKIMFLVNSESAMECSQAGS